jgi:hypothetical protein
MSQYGMHMPGGAMQRKPSMDVYTGLLFVAVLAVAAASVFVWMQGAKVAPDGQPLNLQAANSVKLPAAAPAGR